MVSVDEPRENGARENTAQDNPLFVASLEKGMSVLSVLASSGKPLSLAEISRLTGISRSAAQRFVFTFRSLGYLVQDPDSKHHMLSARVLEFGQAYSSRDALTRIAYPVLESANRKCEETINLTILDGTQVIYVLRFPCRHVVSVNLQIGSRLPAYCTAPGRAMLAHLDEPSLAKIIEATHFEKHTPHTVTDPARLMKILAETREKGYSINDQEAFIGDISVAAAIRRSDGMPVAAVNIAVPSPRWTVARVQSELAPLVIAAAKKISALLGWS